MKVKPRYFTINEAHLILLQRTYVEWFDCETGAPCINPKRPYGNSDVEHDICEILGFEVRGEDDPYTDDQLTYAAKLHKETKTALQICLYRQAFEPGKYMSDDICHREWEKA
jgi:hypothetical protein